MRVSPEKQECDPDDLSRQVAAAAAALEANKEFQNMIMEGSDTQVQARTPNNVVDLRTCWERN